MNGLTRWVLGILGTIVLGLTAAWAIFIMDKLDTMNIYTTRKLEEMDKRIESLAVNVALYASDVKVRDVSTEAKITAVLVRIEAGELRIKAIEATK